MTTTTLPLRAAIYTRVSSRHQQDNFSPETQLAGCRQFAAANGMTIVAEHFDAISGATGADGRPGLSAIVELTTAGAIDAVVFYSADRLSRNAAHAHDLRELFRVHAVRAYSVQGGQQRANMNGRMVSGLMSTIDEGERWRIRERTIRGRSAKVKGGGLVNPTQVPYGYNVGFVINEDHAAVIRRIFERYAAGQGSYTIANDLDRDGIVPPAIARPTNINNANNVDHVSKGLWSRSTILAILANETYAGIRRTIVLGPEDEDGADTTVAGAATVPAIVGRDVWEACVRQRKANAVHAPRNSHRSYLLSGMLRCWCGRPRGGMFRKARPGNPQDHYTYYRCIAQHPERATLHPERTPLIRCDVLDQLVWSHFVSVMNDKVIRDYYQKMRKDSGQAVDRLQDERRRYEQQIAAAEAAKKRLVAAVASGVLELGDVAEAKAEIDTRIASCRTEIARVDGEIGTLDHSVEKEEATVAKVRAIRERIASGLSPVGEHDALRSMDTRVELERTAEGIVPVVTVDGLEPVRLRII